MYRWIKHFITRSRAEHARKLALSQAEQARKAALEALQDAKRRGDTRDQHAAYKSVRAATHSELRLVVGR